VALGQYGIHARLVVHEFERGVHWVAAECNGKVEQVAFGIWQGGCKAQRKEA